MWLEEALGLESQRLILFPLGDLLFLGLAVDCLEYFVKSVRRYTTSFHLPTLIPLMLKSP